MHIEELIRIMAALRSAEGCPWDREQTRESLKPFIIEEAYEVLEAIDERDPAAIREELGDLLFQVIFQCQLASELGEFTLADVIEKIAEKMISRHPHVFGDADVRTAAEVLIKWDEHKKLEGKQRDSLLEGVPKTLPALQQAHKLQSRASKVGFDWTHHDAIFDKLDEEIDEFRTAINGKNIKEIEDELGDVLFTLVNIARHIGLNPEEALRKTIGKFISRFRHMEMTAKKQERNLKDMTLDEMDALWDEAKRLKE